MAWHIAVLGRVQEVPELHMLTGEAPPEEDETEEEHAARIWRNSMAWVIATGGTMEIEAAPEQGA